jgi:dihydrofolate reductase
MNRKLKLQIQMTIDGFVAGPNGELDWMNFDWSEDIKNYVTELTSSVDTILLGRKMTDEFINHWTNQVKNNPNSEEYDFAKKMVAYKKFVFTKTLEKSNWNNTELVKGNLSEEIKKIKEMEGKDIIVYGGAEFVSNLIAEDLIDEFHLSINPVVIGKGMSIFNKLSNKQNLKLIKSQKFDCGEVVLVYQRSLK